MSAIDFTPEPFRPHPMMQNTHVQTLAGKYFRSESGVTFRRQRLDTPDGDFVDLDFADVEGATWQDLGDDAPILLLLHGLEGCAKTPYSCVTYRKAARLGLRPVGMNFRSCSGEMNRTARFYHMGATDDVRVVHNYLREQFGDVALCVIGYSLGGNMLLKYLGEGGTALRDDINAAVAVSPPFVATGKQAINHGMGRFYGEYLLRKLRQKVRLKAYDLRDTNADIHAALHSHTLRDFDEAITAPLHGFADADDYYATCNSVNFLPDIRVPTLLIRAQDDPFFNNDIPHDIIDANPCLVGTFPAKGGHVGFIEGNIPRRHNDWAQQQAMRFFQQMLSPAT